MRQFHYVRSNINTPERMKNAEYSKTFVMVLVRLKQELCIMKAAAPIFGETQIC